MADVLDIDNAEEFEVDEDGDRKYHMKVENYCILKFFFFILKRGNCAS